MKEPTPFAFTQLFTPLTGRDLKFELLPHPPTMSSACIYGSYREDDSGAIVLKSDLKLWASLAGLLLGLPDTTAVERAQSNPMDESIRDAMHECLNIASTALSTEHRVVFQTMATDPVYCPSEALAVLKSPDRSSSYKVSIEGELKGAFTLLSNY